MQTAGDGEEMETHGRGGTSLQKPQASESEHDTPHRPPATAQTQHRAKELSVLPIQTTKQVPSFYCWGCFCPGKHTHGPLNPRSTLITDGDAVAGPAWSTRPTSGCNGHSPWMGVACQAGAPRGGWPSAPTSLLWAQVSWGKGGELDQAGDTLQGGGGAAWPLTHTCKQHKEKAG